MTSKDLPKAFRALKISFKKNRVPYVTIVAEKRHDPFLVLISCIISLRTKDEVTHFASERLFALASTPKDVSALDVERIEKAIFPAGFYRTKARTIKEVSARLFEEFSSCVPNTVEGLLEFKGVGRKTANLVVTLGYDLPGICVDTHVHRITNRWGYVTTRTPEETEFALRAKLPRRYWIPINDLLVSYGQFVCTPISPYCSECAISPHCDKRGVLRSR